jgi:TatD DNase family protein
LREFADDLSVVLKRADSEGINKILVPGIDLETSQESIKLSEKYPDSLYAAIGIHPNNSSGFNRENLIILEKLLNHPKVVAVGEIGLDFYRKYSSIDDQISVFSDMLTLSRNSNKPICIHNRDADQKIISLLEQWYLEIKGSSSRLVAHPGVFHSFTGSEIISTWALAHNFYLGIGGPITYPNNHGLYKAVEEIDIKHLIIETDSPYLSPQQHRGKRNEPSYVKFVAEKIAEIKKMDLLAVVEQTSNNSKTLFGWE